VIHGVVFDRPRPPAIAASCDVLADLLTVVAWLQVS
jgi:hypothetical protein